MPDSDLQPISPKRAQELYLEERQEDARYSTIQTVEQGTDLFTEWCINRGLNNMNNLTGRGLQDFKHYCKQNTEKNKISLNGMLSTVRRFLVFCVNIEAVSTDLPSKVPISKTADDEDVCYEKPSKEEVEQILQYLEKYEYASRRHVEFAIIHEIGCRVGALRAIDDPEDLALDDDEPALKLRHRPEGKPDEKKGTPLKNGKDGQRNVNISTELVEIIQAYRDRPDQKSVTDQFGRNPLLKTSDGRPRVATIRRDFYKLTRPCTVTSQCPHKDYDMDSCEAKRRNSEASKCPSSFTPHPLRRFSIEKQIDQGVPKDILSDRTNVSVPVLNKHYDTRSEERKRKQRLKSLEKLFDGYGDPKETLTPREFAAVTNDDGMIDPVELHGLIRQDDTVNKTDGAGCNSRNGDKGDEKQLTFEEFDKTLQINHPAIVPTIVAVRVGSWVPDRLRRELEAMTPASEPSPWPGPNRAAKAIAAYALFSFMIAFNLTLIGLLPV